jgi:hypothetical protein
LHLLAVHILAGLTCLVSGAAAALSPKRPGRHPRRGTLSYRSRWMVVASAAGLAALRWPQDAHLLVPGACVGRRDLGLPLRWVRQLDPG